MSYLNVSLAAIIAVFSISGCKSNVMNTLHSKQEVKIESIPSGSDVYLGGEFIGKTPMIMSLRSDICHEIHFQKEGFKPTSEYLDPIYKNDKTPYIQFGLAKDLGYYYKLSSDYIISELQWEYLPNSSGITPLESMLELITKADKAKLSGALSKEEHEIIMRQIVELYN